MSCCVRRTATACACCRGRRRASALRHLDPPAPLLRPPRACRILRSLAAGRWDRRHRAPCAGGARAVCGALQSWQHSAGRPVLKQCVCLQGAFGRINPIARPYEACRRGEHGGGGRLLRSEARARSARPAAGACITSWPQRAAASWLILANTPGRLISGWELGGGRYAAARRRRHARAPPPPRTFAMAVSLVPSITPHTSRRTYASRAPLPSIREPHRSCSALRLFSATRLLVCTRSAGLRTVHGMMCMAGPRVSAVRARQAPIPSPPLPTT